jgi:NADP-dependent 3-hydroxy acid dehydrogenase YdfG
MAVFTYWLTWLVVISQEKSISELDENEWDLMITMNLKSAFLISKHVVSQMISSKYRKIIHVSFRTGL